MQDVITLSGAMSYDKEESKGLKQFMNDLF